MRVLYNRKWFTPMEIAKLGLIKSSASSANDVYKGSVAGNYNFILKLIKTGRLTAKNYANGKKPYWLVPEDAIVRYHDTVTIIGPKARKG